jgi:hypothetical protein
MPPSSPSISHESDRQSFSKLRAILQGRLPGEAAGQGSD